MKFANEAEKVVVDDAPPPTIRSSEKCRVPRIEVFSVRINNDDTDDNEPPADIYGTITIFDAFNHHQEIFNREKGDYNSFLTNIDTELILTGPPCSSLLDTSYDFSMVVALMNDDEDNDSTSFIPYTSMDIFHSHSHYALVMSIPSDWRITLDKVRNQTVFGEFGSVTVNYIMFSDATRADIEILIINTKENCKHDSFNVRGRITARNTQFMEYESLIFRRHKGIHVTHGETIPLSRSLIALPSQSSLIIGAELLADCDGGIISIAKGDVEFRASKFPTTSEKIISGQNGEIVVKVTWRHVDIVENQYYH